VKIKIGGLDHFMVCICQSFVCLFQLGGLIGEMQAQMDDLVWVNRELEEKLQAALREQEAMDALLDEMEDENEDAFARIHALETQVAAYSTTIMPVILLRAC
jgi:hypothetical protein